MLTKIYFLIFTLGIFATSAVEAGLGKRRRSDESTTTTPHTSTTEHPNLSTEFPIGVHCFKHSKEQNRQTKTCCSSLKLTCREFKNADGKHSSKPTHGNDCEVNNKDEKDKMKKCCWKKHGNIINEREIVQGAGKCKHSHHSN